jgi:hypothetical protein
VTLQSQEIKQHVPQIAKVSLWIVLGQQASEGSSEEGQMIAQEENDRPASLLQQSFLTALESVSLFTREKAHELQLAAYMIGPLALRLPRLQPEGPIKSCDAR